MCTLHAARAKEGKPLHPDHERVGEPSGFGLYGVVTRTDTTVLCHECGREFRALVQHLRQAHSLTVAAYRRQHGLAENDPLWCQDSLDAISVTSRRQIGTPAWRRFEAGRDATHDDSLRRAATTPRRAGALRRHADRLSDRARTITRTCRWCDTPLDPRNRNTTTCSPACARLGKTFAAGRRSARIAGEPHDFQRGDGTGAKLTEQQAAARMGLTLAAFRARVRRGAASAHDGRTNAVKWWWESTVHPLG
jgi:hypothetical protein